MKSIILVPALVLAGLLVGCSRKPPPATTEVTVSGDTVTLPTNAPQLSALTVEVVGTERPAAVPLSGRLTWDDDVTARVFTPFAGIVRKLLGELNQTVTNGETLAEIQSPDFGQAQADARKAQSDLLRAERNLNRLRNLFEHGAAPRKDLDNAEADFASAQAEKERAENRLAIYGATTASTNRVFLLPSPVDGVLVERNVTPGQEVRPDQMLANIPQITAPLFVVTDPTKLWLQIDASEADLTHLRPGRDFTFTSHAYPGQTFTAQVAVVSQFLDPNTRTIKVRGKVNNARCLLKAEMFVNVNLPGEGKAGASLPSKAVYLKGDKHYVFVESSPGQFERHEVQLGAEQDGQVLVLAGLEPGQRIVTDGCILLEQTLK